MFTSKLTSEIIPNINSTDGKIMFAAVIALLVVVCLVVVLHIYARCMIGRANRRRISVTSVVRLNHLHVGSTLPPVYDDSGNNMNQQMESGLDATSIGLLPLFVYKSDECKHGLECVICMSAFDDDDMGRYLPNCKHAFHVECVDRWLGSNSNCPICRDNVALEKVVEVDSVSTDNVEIDDSLQRASVSGEEVHIVIPHDSEPKCPSSPAPTLPPAPSLPAPCRGISLRRMLSMNKNKLEHKVFPSCSLNELTV